MQVEIKIPSPGESISEVEIAAWMVEDGDFVEKNQEIAEIESDKATLSLIAEATGKIKIIAPLNEAVAVDSVACIIDTEAEGAPAPKAEKATVNEVPAKAEVKADAKNVVVETSTKHPNAKVTPVAKKMMDEYQLSVDDVIEGLKKIGKNEVQEALDQVSQSNSIPSKGIDFTPSSEVSRDIERTKMSSLRKKLSQRLVAVKNETAMLTTFNEVDMKPIMDLRKKYQKFFVEKHGVKVGFMSLFLKAAAEALMLYPEVNAMIDGDEIQYHKYADIGIAVQSAKGLMVPVIRNVENQSLASIELTIKDFAKRGQANKIKLDELLGGTFTITNGGTFGSLMSTPIINPPQSGILGMHNIVERPMAIEGQVVIRPMMYIAMSYDHRIIDGKSAVGFLVKVKDLLENPIQLLFKGIDPERLLLDL